jgi:2-polyprenyl-6-hydroxyphenyl methylase/3-demethylubiquinone-9 3-methyltransferase
MTHPALKVFQSLPFKERLFVRGRLALAPLEEVAARARGTTILDVGCGHGVLVALLAHGHPERRIVGIDPHVQKIDWARGAFSANPNIEMRACLIEELAAERPGEFDSVIVADVLCLVAQDLWPSFLAAAHALLRPGGQLLLKDAEDDGSWRVTKALWQERLMVKLLRRTQSTGGIGFVSRSVWQRTLVAAGFVVDDTTAFGGYTAPHVLFTARVA